MAVITSENREAWQTLVTQLSKNNPLNRGIKVVSGRKHKGKEGVVIKLIRDQYNEDAWRYASEAQTLYREVEGTYGFVALVKQADGTEFWVKATYLKIVD